MLSIAVDTAKITKLKEKFEKYPPYAIKRGLSDSAAYLNQPNIKASMQAADTNAPFVWSSDRQRRAYFATDGFGGGIPYSRTGGLVQAGEFTINETSYWVEYTNPLPWWKYVMHPSYQIIGHRLRGWPVINRWVVGQSGRVVPEFKKGVLAAWSEMESFMFGGGGGL